jgi:diguanylate cyclase (GGDEF)-like protein
MSIEPWRIFLSFIGSRLRERISDAPTGKKIERYVKKMEAVVLNVGGRRQNSGKLELRHRLWAIRQFFSALSSAITLDEVVEQIRINLPKVDMSSCYIVTYPEPVRYIKGSRWTMPNTGRLLLHYQNFQGKKDENDLPVRNCQVLPRSVSHGATRIMQVLSPLYYREDQLGYILMEVSETAHEMYDLIAGQISTLLKTSMLFQSQMDSESRLRLALDELETYNRQLQNISEMDELSWLYNRRGFMSIAAQSLSLAMKMHKTGMLFFADLDGLKGINDLYGHEAGDLAIKAAGDALVKTFRTMDIIARLGGDEFTVFTADAPASFNLTAASRLEQQLASYNEGSGYPWKISLSMGSEAIAAGDTRKLSEIMQSADAKLYEIKYRKKRAKKNS